MLKNKLCFIEIVILVFIASFLLTNFSQAALVGNTNQAILSISPQIGAYNVNDNLTASIYINTNGQNVVVAAAYLNYDKTHFEAVNIDTAGSVFTIEAEKVIDANNGIIKITLGKPTPGVNVSNGLVAKINFKALSAVSPTADNFTFQFTAGAANESNVIKDDGLGTDILSGVYNAIYTFASSVSTKFSLNDRVQVSSGPLNVRATASASGILLGTQAANALGTVIGGPTYADGYWWWNINYDTGADGWSVENYLEKYASSTCVSFTYSDWSACQPNNTQSRTVISSSPQGCMGGNPVLTQSCGGEALQCTIDSDCYPAGFILGKCGAFYTCASGKCYEGSRECPKEEIIEDESQQKIDNLSLEIKTVQQSLLSLLSLISADPKNPEISSRLAAIQKSVNELIIKLQEIQSYAPKPLFISNLYLGESGSEVKTLQEFLSQTPEIYPERLITGYFGYLTRKAVQRFQCKYNIVCSGDEISTGYGIVGPKTRTKLNELINK